MSLASSITGTHTLPLFLLSIFYVPALYYLIIYQLFSIGASSAATVAAGAGNASTSSAATDAMGGDHKDKGMDADDREADDVYGLSAILDVFNTAGGYSLTSRDWETTKNSSFSPDLV